MAVRSGVGRVACLPAGGHLARGLVIIAGCGLSGCLVCGRLGLVRLVVLRGRILARLGPAGWLPRCECRFPGAVALPVGLAGLGLFPAGPQGRGWLSLLALRGLSLFWAVGGVGSLGAFLACGIRPGRVSVAGVAGGLASVPHGGLPVPGFRGPEGLAV